MKKSSGTALVLICAVGLFVRLLAAPHREIEFRADTLLFQVWGYTAYEHGITNVYDVAVVYPPSVAREAARVVTQRDVNYLPPYLYAMWGTETLRRWLSPSSPLGGVFASVFQKLPGLLFDLATAILLYCIVYPRSGDGWGLAVAAIYVFHPALLYLSAGWGQVDTILAFFLVLAVWLMERSSLLWAASALTFACLVKMQAVVLVPLLVFEMAATRSVKTILSCIAAACATALLVTLPYLVTGHLWRLIQVVFSNTGKFPAASMFAFNFWWLVTAGRGLSVGDATTILGLSLKFYGGVLYASAIVLVLVAHARQRPAAAIWLTASLLALAFFLFPTEMHERYMFPVLAVLLPTVPIFRLSRIGYVILSVTFASGIVCASTLEPLLRQPRLLTVLFAGLNVALFVALLFVSWQLRRQPEQM